MKDVQVVAAILFSMLREHLLLTDTVAYHYTAKVDQKIEGFFTYTQLIDKKFPGYTCGANQEMVPMEGTRTVNFKDFWEMMRSSDPADLEKLRWMFDGEYRFLDSKGPVAPQKIGYCTFPRSGNSFLRRILEGVTGIASGSTI